MVTPTGTLAPVGSPDFNQYLIRRLHNPHLVRPRPPSDSRGYNRIVRVPSASSQRAKLGFKYWIDTPNKSHTTSGDACIETTLHNNNNYYAGIELQCCLGSQLIFVKLFLQLERILLDQEVPSLESVYHGCDA